MYVAIAFFVIYIPHWLDSMCDLALQITYSSIIYIPHWLDSMRKGFAFIKRALKDLHSTLVRFYVRNKLYFL